MWAIPLIALSVGLAVAVLLRALETRCPHQFSYRPEPREHFRCTLCGKEVPL